LNVRRFTNNDSINIPNPTGYSNYVILNEKQYNALKKKSLLSIILSKSGSGFEDETFTGGYKTEKLGILLLRLDPVPANSLLFNNYSEKYENARKFFSKWEKLIKTFIVISSCK
jgi:hypothetical protein